jgi:hypothetical protein
MKSKINKLNQMPDTPYPCLKINNVTGSIILFNQKHCGVLVHKGKRSEYDVGYYGKDWDEKNFVLFQDEITLSN